MAPNAVASPAADLAAIGRDYAGDQKITPCRFAKEQLKAARHEITPDIETYATGLRDAVTRAIRRWTNGDCRGKRGGARLSIVLVRPRGEAGEESVTIKNLSRRTVNLRNYALRDSTDHTLRLRATRLKAGRTLRVVTGCRSGHPGVVRRGSSYYACRSKQVWDDAGDLVELLGPGGGLLASKQY